MKSEERQFLIESLCEDLVPMIMDKYGLSDKAAIKKLYTSSTFSKLEDPETGLYYQSPVYLFDMLFPFSLFVPLPVRFSHAKVLRPSVRQVPLRYRPQGLRGSLPQIKDELSVPRPAYRDRLPAHACRVGYSAHSSARFLALPVLRAVCPACKIRSPARMLEGSEKREKKQSSTNLISRVCTA